MNHFFKILLILLFLGVGSFVTAQSKSLDITYLLVDLSAQKVYVITNQVVVKEMKCSTGLPDTPTPVGTFRIVHKGSWLWSKQFQVGVKYWSAFTKNGQFLFHSVPTDPKGIPNPVSISKLGKPASHGCIRLNINDAKWIYDHIKISTRVVIRP